MVGSRIAATVSVRGASGARSTAKIGTWRYLQTGSASPNLPFVQHHQRGPPRSAWSWNTSEDRVRIHLPFAAQIGVSDGAEVGNLAVSRDQGDESRHLPAGHFDRRGHCPCGRAVSAKPRSSARGDTRGRSRGLWLQNIGFVLSSNLLVSVLNCLQIPRDGFYWRTTCARRPRKYPGHKANDA